MPAAKKENNYDEILKNQKDYLQTPGIIYSIKFIFKAMGKNVFDLFPLDISKEHKILSNKLSRIQLLVIKFPSYLFLVTFISSSTTNTQLNQTIKRVLSVNVKVMYHLFRWAGVVGMLLAVCFFPITYSVTQKD